MQDQLHRTRWLPFPRASGDVSRKTSESKDKLQPVPRSRGYCKTSCTGRGGSLLPVQAGIFPVSRPNRTANSNLVGDCRHHTGGSEEIAKPSEAKHARRPPPRWLRSKREASRGPAVRPPLHRWVSSKCQPSKVRQFVRHHTGGLRGLYGAPSPYWRTVIGGSQAFRLATAVSRSFRRR